MRDFAKKQRILEINAKSPLIQGLLRRVEQLPSEEEARDPEVEEELKEVASVLIDGALVRSGFDCPYVSVALFREIRQLTHPFLNQVRTLPPSYCSLTLPAVAPELGQFLAFIVWNLFIWFDSLVNASSSFRLRC